MRLYASALLILAMWLPALHSEQFCNRNNYFTVYGNGARCNCGTGQCIGGGSSSSCGDYPYFCDYISRYMSLCSDCVSTCSNPPPGKYVVGVCGIGGSDTQFADCSTISHPNITIGVTYVACTPGTPNILGQDTHIGNCTPTPGPRSGEYQAGPCTATADTVINYCSSPASGQYVTAVCTSFNDTQLATCTDYTTANATLGKTYFRPCLAGNMYWLGRDALLLPCTVPQVGQTYIRTPCTIYFDSVLGTCSWPKPGQYVVELCTANSDTKFANCTQGFDCVPGSPTSLGSTFLSSKSSFPSWAIAVLVIGVAAVVAGALFVVYKKKRNAAATTITGDVGGESEGAGAGGYTPLTSV